MADGRPVIGLTLKIRYAPFPDEVLARALDLAVDIEPGRPIRLLGLRAEMAMPDDAGKGRTPTRGGW